MLLSWDISTEHTGTFKSGDKNSQDDNCWVSFLRSLLLISIQDDFVQSKNKVIQVKQQQLEFQEQK